MKQTVTDLTWVIAIAALTACGSDSKSEGDADADAQDVMDAEDTGGEADAPLDGDADAGEDVVEEDPATEDADGEDASWVNPGCDAERNVVEDGLVLEITVDLRQQDTGTFPIHERITVTAPEAGDAITLFGESFEMGWASAGYDYDGHTATFCTGAFEAGEEVVVEAEFVAIEHDIPAGLKRWSAEDGIVAIGPSTEPYFAPLWILVPQSLHSVDDVHDDSPAVEGLEISVIAPDETWTVVGPGGEGTRSGSTWSFALDVIQPIYAISFAASPDYEVFTVGTTASGVEVVAAVTPSSRSDAESSFPSAITTIDWMEENVGAWEWGDTLTIADIPDYGGGMEHSTIIWLGSDTIRSAPDGWFIVVHETVHHWWGDSVRFADWPHFWLAEGFDEWSTNYNILGELLTAEQFAALKLEYRTQGAELTYPYFPALPDPGPLRFADDEDVVNQWILNMSLFYIYGAAFLEMVHQRLIRDFSTDLHAVLVDWYATWRLQETTTEEFLSFLETTTGDSTYWAPLFDDWVYKTPAPTLTLSGYGYSGGTATVTVERTDGADQNLDDLEVVFVSGVDTYPTTVDLPAGTDADVATVSMPGAPDRIVVDPDAFYVVVLETEGAWTGPTVAFTYE